MAKSDVDEPERADPGDVESYLGQLAEVAARGAGAQDVQDQAVAFAEAQRVTAWGLRLAVGLAREQGFTWRELSGLLDVPAATLHRQFRSGKPITSGPPVGVDESEPAYARSGWTLRAPPPEPPAAPTTSFPRPADLFVGRDNELAEARGLVWRHGLVSVVGPGGVGKTRLVAELTDRVAGSYTGGVWWVELAPIGDPELVVAAIVAAAGSSWAGRPIDEVIAGSLTRGPVLLILDNAEHLAGGIAATVARLRAAHRGLHLLVTSRESLRIPGEVVLTIDPLPPAAGPQARKSPAVRLFADRARAVARDVDLDTQAAVVAEICDRLDGLPLAIELAARQIRMLSPQVLLARFQEQLDLLTGGPRTASGRHQSLRAAIQWSYELLDETEQAVFRRLAVLPGGFDQRTAAAVTADLDLSRAQLWALLAALTDKSLVAADPHRSARFRILESLRAYGREQLVAAAELDAAHDRLFDWIHHVRRTIPQNPREYAARENWLFAEHDNIRYAAETAHTNGDPRYPNLALALSSALRERADHVLFAPLMEHLLAEHELSLEDRVWAHCRLTEALAALGDQPASRRQADLCLEVARSIGEDWLLAVALSNLVYVHRMAGEASAAIRLTRELLELRQGSADATELGAYLDELAWHLLNDGQHAAANDAISQALALYGVKPGDTDLDPAVFAHYHGMELLRVAALVRWAGGDASGADAYLATALRGPTGDVGEQMLLVQAVALVAATRGQWERAVRLAAAADAALAARRLVIEPWLAARVATIGVDAGRALSPPVLRAIRAAGAALPHDEVITYALTDRLPGKSADQGGLTPREYQVAELVAQGFTNAQIATRLSMSARTVASHLSHIRAALNLPSRVHVARWFNEHTVS